MKQREIKFRFWSTDLQSMSTPMELKEFVNNELFEIPMQYTGLKDKNGKEIYEGDIVERVMSEKPFRSIVKYGDFYIDDSEYYYPAFGFYFDNCIESYKPQFTEKYWCLQGECKVIGNIYSNPELLK